MTGIRGKLIISLLLITLLPVFPIYYLVKNLVQQSIEVGYNQNVETALESARDISRELYARYKQETLQMATEIATLPAATAIVRGGSISQTVNSKLVLIAPARADFFNPSGEIRNSAADSLGRTLAPIYQNMSVPLAEMSEAQLLEGAGEAGTVVAFAPIPSADRRVGSVVVTRRVAPEFTRQRKLVVEVLQMFKTLNFFEGDVQRGFLLLFFSIYAPIAALSIGLGIYFSRRITKPLLQLSQATQQVARGDWDYRVKITSRDEVGALGEAFNRMIIALKEKQDQVVALEKMAVWREIARVLAHEIKNPLTPIQLMVEQLRDKYAHDDPEYGKLLDECTEIITDEIENLRALVREFSEFARMPGLSFTTGNLNELVEEVRRIYPNDNINLNLDPELPESEFDHEKMRRVLINLLENGMDSIREKGSGDISVQTQSENGAIHIIYSDTGGGIAPELQSKIFEPYFSTKKSGMGLGMAIVKRVITEHGGAILLSSQPGEGAQFHITLPIMQEKEQA